MAQVQHGDVDSWMRQVVTDCKFPASEGNLYSQNCIISVTHGDTQRPGEDTCNVHQVLLHIISLHPNG